MVRIKDFRPYFPFANCENYSHLTHLNSTYGFRLRERTGE